MNTFDDSTPLTELYGTSDDDVDGRLDDSDADVGQRIREAREAAGLEQVDLADPLGVDIDVVAAWEAGTTTPSGHRLARLAGLLGVSLSWLMIGHGTEPVERDQAIAELRAAITAARERINGTLDELETRLDLLPAD